MTINEVMPRTKAQLRQEDKRHINVNHYNFNNNYNYNCLTYQVLKSKQKIYLASNSYFYICKTTLN